MKRKKLKFKRKLEGEMGEKNDIEVILKEIGKQISKKKKVKKREKSSITGRIHAHARKRACHQHATSNGHQQAHALQAQVRGI